MTLQYLIRSYIVCVPLHPLIIFLFSHSLLASPVPRLFPEHSKHIGSLYLLFSYMDSSSLVTVLAHDLTSPESLLR